MAVIVLDDGKARNAGEILSAGLERGIVRSDVRAQAIFDSLARYIQRAHMLGRRSVITMDEYRRFRVDQPPDEWPDPARPVTRPSAPTSQALVAQLRATCTGEDATGFEIAVCQAFSALGFVATHLGGHEAPDGVLDAPLGPLAYRAMLECKTWQGTRVPRVDVAEAAKYRPAFHADIALLVVPALAEYDMEFNSELRTHEVSAWSVDDVAQLLEIGADPHELRALFVPGIGADHLGDLLWERRHGAAKRVTVAAELLWQTVWDQQKQLVGSPDVPAIDEDAAMLLLDQSLRARGSSATADRVTVRLAIAQLSARTCAAAAEGDRLVIVRPPPETAAQPAASSPRDSKTRRLYTWLNSRAGPSRGR